MTIARVARARLRKYKKKRWLERKIKGHGTKWSKPREEFSLEETRIPGIPSERPIAASRAHLWRHEDGIDKGPTLLSSPIYSTQNLLFSRRRILDGFLSRFYFTGIFPFALRGEKRRQVLNFITRRMFYGIRKTRILLNFFFF